MKAGVGVGVGVFVWKNGRFIMAKRGPASSHGVGTWSIPGGKLEPGESWEDAAKREVYEETGMVIARLRFLAVTNDVFPDERLHYVTIWMESDWLSGEPTVGEPHKMAHLEWRTLKTLPAPLFEPCWQNLKRAKPQLFL